MTTGKYLHVYIFPNEPWLLRSVDSNSNSHFKFKSKFYFPIHDTKNSSTRLYKINSINI